MKINLTKTKGGKGIYMIKNLVNGKVYIGSAHQLNVRKWNHFSQLRLKKHKNKHLQAAYNKYGECSFEFIPIQYVDTPGKIFKEEQFWIDFFWGKDCYNQGRVAQGGNFGIPWNKGKKMSPEHCEKLSKASPRRKRTKEVNEKIKTTIKAKYECNPINSPEAREKARLSMIGKKKTPEDIAKRTETRRINRLAKLSF